MGTGVAGTAVKLVNLFSSEDEEVPCGVWGFLGMIVYSSLLHTGAICQVFGLWYRYLTSSATLILPDSSFSPLASFVWDVNEKIITWQ